MDSSVDTDLKHLLNQLPDRLDRMRWLIQFDPVSIRQRWLLDECAYLLAAEALELWPKNDCIIGPAEDMVEKLKGWRSLPLRAINNYELESISATIFNVTKYSRKKIYRPLSTVFIQISAVPYYERNLTLDDNPTVIRSVFNIAGNALDEARQLAKRRKRSKR